MKIFGSFIAPLRQLRYKSVGGRAQKSGYLSSGPDFTTWQVPVGLPQQSLTSSPIT